MGRKPKSLETVEMEMTQMSEVIQHGEKIHQIYRDITLVGNADPNAWPLQNVTAYVDEYLKLGWKLQTTIPCGIRNIGEDARAPRLVLGMLYILVKE